MRKYLIISIVVIFLVIDWFFFHDLMEPKTLPQFLTGLVSILVFLLFFSDYLRGDGKQIKKSEDQQ